MSSVFAKLGAVVACVVWTPLHIGISLLIRLCDSGPAIYRSLRLGKDGDVFELLKYRSMKVNAAPVLTSGLKLIVTEDDPRVTRLGRWLRCGIDEIPQLWNVVRGEMAWIGPRPDADWMLPLYGPVCRRRLAITPGITGLAQVLASRELTVEEGYAIDIWYASHRGIWLDARIALMTPCFIAGWKTIGRAMLEKLRRSEEFQRLRRDCGAELAAANAARASAVAGA